MDGTHIRARAVVEIDLWDRDSRAPQPIEAAPAAPHLIGRGRSAAVYRVQNDGRMIARKVFEGEALAKLVHVVLRGAPNPYTWNEHAIAAAVSRRRILESLVVFWFDDRLRLPAVHESGWDLDARAFFIDMDLVDGRSASLRHPYSAARDDELSELLETIMRPLQQHLIDAGFDGLVWQAGKGNPVATSNFMLEATAGADETPGADDSVRRWTWVDLESGVPALFPLSPAALLGFYVPASWRYRRPMFDDVDADRLRGYLDANAGPLGSRLGGDCVRELRAACEELASHQQAWNATTRLQDSIRYAERRGHITEAEAQHYRRRPLRWYGRLVGRAAARAPGKMMSLPGKIVGKVFPGSPLNMARATWRFLSSQRWRSRLAMHLIRRRIRRWQRRRQLTGEEAAFLTRHVRSEEAGEYLTDFGIHLAIKVPSWFIEWLLFPALYAAGMINEVVLLVALATGGILGRTAYTSGRMVQATLRGQERPWVALAVGLLPVVGIGAYPAQIVYTSTERDHDVAQFILYDLFATIGRRVPVWGGADTETEHRFNRMPGVLFRRTRRKATT